MRNTIYTKPAPLTIEENKYDVMPLQSSDYNLGSSHFCLAQTLNLAAARKKSSTHLEKLEKIVAESRHWAIKTIKISHD